MQSDSLEGSGMRELGKHTNSRLLKGTYKGSEQYLDDEDRKLVADLSTITLNATLQGMKWNRDLTAEPIPPVTVLELLKAVEDLRNHLRRKYFGG
jgi:hypothetical protein